MATIEAEGDPSAAAKNAPPNIQSPIFSSTIALTIAFNSLDDAAFTNLIKQSIPYNIINSHANNPIFRHILLPLILQLKVEMGAAQVDGMFADDVKLIKMSYQQTKKNNNGPLGSLLHNRSSFVILLSILARGDDFIDSLLDDTNGWVNLGDEEALRSAQRRRNKSVLIQYADKTSNQVTEKRRTFEKKFMTLEEKAAEASEDPPDWLSFFSEEMVRMLKLTYPDYKTFLDDTEAKLKRERNIGGAAGGAAGAAGATGVGAGGGGGGGAAGSPSPPARSTSHSSPVGKGNYRNLKYIFFCHVVREKARGGSPLKTSLTTFSNSLTFSAHSHALR
jgi:hypothetical protein